MSNALNWFEIPVTDLAKQFYGRVLQAELREETLNGMTFAILFYWGAVWTLVAWCELRNDHRNFRLDRIANPEVLAEPFSLGTGQTLADFLRKVQGPR